jgi:hypothetical protein
VPTICAALEQGTSRSEAMGALEALHKELMHHVEDRQVTVGVPSVCGCAVSDLSVAADARGNSGGHFDEAVARAHG